MLLRLFAALCLAAAATWVSLAVAAGPVPPLVIVPGYTSSYLQVSFGANPPLVCPKNQTWLSLWPLDKFFQGIYLPCALLIIETYFNATTNKYDQLRDVYVRPKDFGGLDGFGFNPGPLEPYGWQPGKTMFGAPYDWRYAPDAQADFHNQLKALVENVTATTKNKTVLLASSNGPMITLGFLYAMSQAWKNQHICGFVAISPVFGGTPTALMYAAEGATGYPFPPETVRLLSASWPSSYWNMPRAGKNPGMYNDSEILIYTPSKNYTASKIDQYLQDMGFNAYVPLWKHVSTVTSVPFPDPGVNTIVTYGYGISTPGAYEFVADLPKNAAIRPAIKRTISVDGDNLVPVQSSIRANYTWPATLKQKGLTFFMKGYKGQAHADCLGDKTCFQDMVAQVLALKC